MIRSDFPMGVFPSVALDGGRGWMALRVGDPRQDGGAIVVYEWVGCDIHQAQEIRRWPLPAGSPAFPHLHVLDGQLWLAYHDGSVLTLRNIQAGASRQFEALSNPVAFGGPFFAYCSPAHPYLVTLLDLRTGATSQPRMGAPTGLSRIVGSTVITIDEDRLALPGATIPSFAGPLAVGEGPTRGVLWSHGTLTSVLWMPLDSFTPQCATDGGTMAISTAGSGSVRLFCGSLDELIAESAKLPPPPVQPPLPPFPPRPPEPEPTMYQRQSPHYAHLVAAAARERPDLWEAARKRPDGSRDDSFTRYLIPRLHVIDPKIGFNGKRGTDEKSIDALAYQNPTAANGAEVIDFITGSHEPAWADVTSHGVGKWIAPDATAPPPVGTHAYDGGENDTGTCDRCGQALGAAIHQVTAPPLGPTPGPVAQRPDTAAVVQTLQGAIAALARIQPDQPDAPVPPPVVVDHQHPAYDETQAAISEAAKAYGRRILPPDTAAHLLFGFLLEGRSRADIVEDARERGRG